MSRSLTLSLSLSDVPAWIQEAGSKAGRAAAGLGGWFQLWWQSDVFLGQNTARTAKPRTRLQSIIICASNAEKIM